MTKFRRFLLNIKALIGFELSMQFISLFIVVYFLTRYSRMFYQSTIILNVFVVIWIIAKNQENEYKIGWIAFVALLPLFGGVFYLFFSGNQFWGQEKKRMLEMERRIRKLLSRSTESNICEASFTPGKQTLSYIEEFGPYPYYTDIDSEYYPTGELYYKALLRELRKAKSFIFMEYFIIDQGSMWDGILEILMEKLDEGVDIRIIYDDVGSSVKLPNFYLRKLRRMGIKCVMFNPLIPFISSKYNTRDHRKIVVIDGHCAFTGGINIADEYINERELFGHWKDMGLSVYGEAVWSFTVMFLTMWDYLNKSATDIKSFKAEDFKRRSDMIRREQGEDKACDIIAPYSDNPLDNESVGENIYLNLINKAEKYVYITTPYLILSSHLLKALKLAAKNGVDVRIITPHKPDKWYVHMVSRSFYRTLVESGVKVYEYTPGFMHGKNFVVDDKYAVVGTINMDFRSLYLHFECGVWMMNTPSVRAVKDDFEDTLLSCDELDMPSLKRRNVFGVVISRVFRLFAPLM